MDFITKHNISTSLLVNYMNTSSGTYIAFIQITLKFTPIGVWKNHNDSKYPPYLPVHSYNNLMFLSKSSHRKKNTKKTASTVQTHAVKWRHMQWSLDLWSGTFGGAPRHLYTQKNTEAGRQHHNTNSSTRYYRLKVKVTELFLTLSVSQF